MQRGAGCVTASLTAPSAPRRAGQYALTRKHNRAAIDERWRALTGRGITILTCGFVGLLLGICPGVSKDVSSRALRINSACLASSALSSALSVESSPGLSSFRAVSQHTTVRSSVAERVLKRSRTLRRCEECKSAVTAQTIVKTEQKAGLAAFIHT